MGCVLCEIDEFNPPCQIDPGEHTRIACFFLFRVQTIAEFTERHKLPVSSLYVDRDPSGRKADHRFLVKLQTDLQISPLPHDTPRWNSSSGFKQVSDK